MSVASAINPVPESFPGKARAFQVNAADTVATLIDDAPAGASVALLGVTGPAAIVAGEPIPRGHKIALVPLALGAPVVKFGARIGHATKSIAPGAWVHLHNLGSDLDERSASLELHTGAPTDTRSAYV